DADNTRDVKEHTSDEISEMIREVRERVRARHPSGAAGASGAALPNLMPIVHARDAASAKVAAIGSVNPRPGGLKNRAVQAVKRLIARSLDWHVREQVEFNRGAMACIGSILEALNENNRALSQLAGHFQAQMSALRTQMEGFDGGSLKDLQAHWTQWRVEWEGKLSDSEVYLLRSISELQGAFQHRVTNMEATFREMSKLQHANFEEAVQRQNAGFTAALEKSARDVQERIWVDMQNIRAEYERLIHSELRLIRLRAVTQSTPAPAPLPAEDGPHIDWMRFAERFRGSEEDIRARVRRHVEKFRGVTGVLDIGCGRGEFLELMREAGNPARGVDLNVEAVAQLEAKGLNVARADLFAYLAGLPDASLGGAFCAQVVEHLPPARLPDLIALLAAKLRQGGVAVIETPNPECLAIFATHFYIDPTHRHPVPPALLAFYLEEAGFGSIQLERLSPAIESMPSLASLPGEFRDNFFGCLDYSAVARKL
ncbi:MAG: class I SAM-dependent methyltransferase, partial [Bryobacteraceae bacterium]